MDDYCQYPKLTGMFTHLSLCAIISSIGNGQGLYNPKYISVVSDHGNVGGKHTFGPIICTRGSIPCPVTGIIILLGFMWNRNINSPSYVICVQSFWNCEIVFTFFFF